MSQRQGVTPVDSTGLQTYGYVYDSSAAIWIADPKTAAGGAAGSTQVSLSTGNVLTLPQSTAWVFLAGMSVNSSNELLTQGSAGSTTVNVSSLAGRVRAQNSTAGDFLATVSGNVGQASTVWQVQQGGYVAPSTTVNVSSLAGTVTAKELRAATPAQSTVSVLTSSTPILAANATRLGATLYNESGAIAYVKLGATASLTSYAVQLAIGGYYEVPFGYTGAIDGITVAITAVLRVVELTA